MGLLTAAQLTALEAGAKIAHKVEVICPRSPVGYEYWTTNLIHDETSGTGVRCVESLGARANSVGNISPKSYGSVETTRCEFVIDNSDGKAHRESVDSDGMFYSTNYISSGYMEDPRSCHIKHYRYVKVAGAWSELPGSPWVGKIQEVVYDEYGETATIIAEAYASTILREPWSVDHSHTTQVAASYTPSGIYIGNISSGVDSSGDVWVQLDASESVSYSLTFEFTTVYSPTATTRTRTGSATSSPFTIQYEDTSPPTDWRVCIFRLVLTATVGGRVQYWQSPTIPVVNWDDSATARPW